MEITPWEGWEPLRNWQERLSRLWNDPLFRGEARLWQPSVDVVQTDDAVIVRADVPGVDPQDLDVRVHEQSVTLRGEVRRETESDEGGYHQVERRYGTFYRQLPLPAAVDPNSAEAAYKNGVLEIRLKKEQQAAGRRLNIRTH